LTLWPWPLCLTYILKTLTLGISLNGFYISHEYFLWQDISMGTTILTLALMLDLRIENFNIGYIFWLVATKALTFPICGYQTIWPCDLFDLLIKNFNLGYIFWMVCTRTVIFHMNLFSNNAFPWVPTDLTLWNWHWYFNY
jgi:hypothetical protein